MSPVTKFIDRYFYASMDIGIAVRFMPSKLQSHADVIFFNVFSSYRLNRFINTTAVYHRVVIMTRDNPGL